MPATIKAVVFKTPQLKASRMFFEEVLKLPIKESSVRHFVIYSKGIRLVFVESLSNFEVEIYINDPSKSPTIPDLENYTDSNGIRVVIAAHK
ncbi:hypothetical protein EWM62_00205 [Mucilaginibacter terrigena]|uniref:Glyoxalase n=1 Tax=Mucilaginibacter terrigena TaxID=2492395 RepID=A0A4Q5LQX9_9SPHI|nr:hypothetical protein [Mucilaginibacter terrigena]RYU91901.1 hypothetical protein EWM62_00205 [Mucilaginibacter terrigena]